VIVSATTVGYGDAVPKTDFAKAFTILYLPMITLALAKVRQSPCHVQRLSNGQLW
jgi:Ion channel